MPAYFGRAKALRISEWMHLGTAFLMVLAARLVFSEAPQTGWLLWTGTAIFLALLAWQHFLVKPNDLSRVNLAFFTTNGIASMIFGTLAITDLIF
jgi:4-hydroxybenzoate polyprenyltransferase